MAGIDRAYVALSQVPGVGAKRMSALLAAFGSAGAVLDAPLKQVRAVRGVSRACASAIRNTTEADGDRILDATHQAGAGVLTPSDERFPDLLRTIPDPPLLLFTRGNTALLGREAVAVVGSRDHSPYGRTVTREIAAGIAQAGLVVVSGMARGLDAEAHWAALQVHGGTVGVLGNGIGVVYPAANRELYREVGERGCLVSEFPPGERPNAGSFPRRNRLIAGLCRLTVVIEARHGSGALITAGCALEQGREVAAVPGPITTPRSEGTNALLADGAMLVRGVNDVLREFALERDWGGEPGTASLSERERAVLDGLRDHRSVDRLGEALACSTTEILETITELEVRGLVERDAAGQMQPVGTVHIGPGVRLRS